MFKTLKAKVTLALTALLLLGGGALMGAPRPIAAQGSDPTPVATESCATQDAQGDVAEPKDTAETDNVEQQCGDQNAPDDKAETVEANDDGADTDKVEQQDGPQDQADGQPEAPETAPAK